MNAAPNSVVIGFVLSLLMALLVLMIVAAALRTMGISLWRIIRDDKGWPSVARWQFAVWTIVVLVILAWIYLIRLQSRVVDPIGELPANILALMGISTGAAVASAQVSKAKEKYGTPAPNKVKWGTMLVEGGEPSLGRIQMFAWTIVSVFIYAWVTVLLVSDPAALAAVETLTLPDVDPALLVLMGISQVGYVGSKAVAR